MTREEALIALSFHSGRNSNISDSRWINGFLGSLRRFNGNIIEKNFIDVMECLKVLANEFDSDKIDRNFMADIYGILYQTRLWLEEGGMLSNIDDKIKKKIDIWMKIYSYAIVVLLDYTKEAYEEAFYEYEEYLKGICNYE